MKTQIIAEIGINHNGDLNIAKKLIDISEFAGCDVVKFQKRNPDVCVPEHQKGVMRDTPWGKMTYLEYKHKIEFGQDEYDEIDDYCRGKIAWTASPWDMDSVEFLYKYKPTEDIDLLYLDSYDLDWNNPIPSALHHMKELCAIISKLKKGCIILIDDNNNNIGKGQFVSNFLDNIGAKQLFSEYQIAYEL